MRAPAGGFQLRAIRFGQLERRPVIDRGHAARELPLASAIQLVRRVIGRIEPAGRLQPADGFGINIEALRLASFLVPIQPQPAHILADAFDIFLARPLQVGVVEAQNELPPLAAGEEPVQQSGPEVADMDASRRARREADDGCHSFSRNLLVIG
jgi:hypothetical protein